ncbi:hypothetical protein [Caldibacillus thermoamylovorans]|uniref:hypothetical protein n=1 Tax=Caldibacillus thermoamylovorans TaxID=35841 RepID=UPI001374F11B|nr:hypothetical protein [Caldibacillus thermoamylovorans]
MTTRPNLVTNLRRRKPIFDDETESRRLFCTGPPFLTTRPLSRHRFWSGNFIF